VLMGSSFLVDPSRKIPYATHHIFLLDRKRRVERRDGCVLLTTGSTARFCVCDLCYHGSTARLCACNDWIFLTGVEYAFSTW